MHDQDQKNCTMQYFLVLHKISVQVDELERMGLGARGQTRIERFHMSLGSEWPCRLGCSLSLPQYNSHSYGSLSLRVALSHK